MTQLICKRIDDTDYYYFAPADIPSIHLFSMHCDDAQYFMHKDAWDMIKKTTEDGEEAKVTIAMSVQPGG